MGLVADILGVLGFLSIVIGVGCTSIPVAMVIGGSIMLLISLSAAWSRRDDSEVAG